VTTPNDSAFALESYPPPAPYQAPTEPEEAYAEWWRRVVAAVLDVLLQVPFLVVVLIGATLAQDPASDLATRIVGAVIAVVANIGSFVFSIWNSYIRQGRRGASLGKQCVGILVISAGDARPIGGILTFVRAIAHVLDALPLGLGYLWPLWDRKRQTFADKVMHTVVLHLPGVRF
jgi:uncharacterized RDD family membrane protein YckC